MTIRWGFWVFWISMNAIASFCWGTLVVGFSFEPIAGMLAGVALFVVAYALLDAYLMAQDKPHLSQALRKGVYVKSLLQLLNALLFVGVFASPEVLAGMASFHVTESTLHLDQWLNEFLFVLLNTLITGGLLSIIVAFLTLIISYSTSKSSSQTPNAD